MINLGSGQINEIYLGENKIYQGASSGSSSSDEVADVTFIDYDGTVLHTYTKEEFASLSELPANPSHTGLTAQGWNWTLADAKTFVAEYGLLIIGQSYITNDGKTRVYLTIGENDPKSPTVYFNQSRANGVTFNWGDGSSTETVSGTGYKTISHTYAAAGNYVMTMTVTNGTFAFGSNNITSPFFGSQDTNRKKYANLVTAIEVGSNVTATLAFSAQAFCGMGNLESVSMPTGPTTGFNYSRLFSACDKIKGFVFPSGVTNIGNYTFMGCGALEYVSFPKSVTELKNNTFFVTHSLKAASLPPSITSVDSQFYNCGCKRCTIPSGLTNLGSYFAYNTNIEKAVVPSTVTTYGTSQFYYCSNLKSITLPSTMTTIPNYFLGYCTLLENVELPSNITSIGTYAFFQCNSLVELTIPSEVTSMGQNCMNSCVSLKRLVMLPSSPPTFGTTMLNSTPSNLEIVVPSGSLSAYQSATGWSGYASKMVEASS